MTHTDDDLPVVQTHESSRRNILGGLAAGAFAAAAILRGAVAKASVAGEENITLGAILSQAKVLVQEAKDLKKEYYDKHIKLVMDEVKDGRDMLNTARETADTVKNEKAALSGGIGSMAELHKLSLSYDHKVNMLAGIIDSTSGINSKFADQDKKFQKIAGDVSPEQAGALKGKRRVYALVSESRTQSVMSEGKLEQIQARDAAAIKQLDASGAKKVDQVHGSNAIKLSSLSDKQDEVIRLLAKNNDLLEAILLHQTTGDIDSRYGDKMRTDKDAASRVESAAKGFWWKQTVAIKTAMLPEKSGSEEA